MEGEEDDGDCCCVGLIDTCVLLCVCVCVVGGSFVLVLGFRLFITVLFHWRCRSDFSRLLCCRWLVG